MPKTFTSGSLTVKEPPTHTQQLLLDVPPKKEFDTPAEARARYGRAVEEIVTDMFSLCPIPNSGSADIVYDAHGRGTYCEIKSLHHSSALPIYEWRRAKDRRSGKKLVYIVAIHRVRCAGGVFRAWEQLSETLDTVLVLPFHIIDKLAPRFKLRQLVVQDDESRVGYKRKGYCKGYRNIPRSVLAKCRYRPGVTQRLERFGLNFECNVRVHCSLNGQWEELALNVDGHGDLDPS